MSCSMCMAPVEGRGVCVCSGATTGTSPLPPDAIPIPPSQSAQADTVTSPTTPLLLPRYHCTNLPTINLYPSNSSLLGAHIQHLATRWSTFFFPRKDEVRRLGLTPRGGE